MTWPVSDYHVYGLTQLDQCQYVEVNNDFVPSNRLELQPKRDSLNECVFVCVSFCMCEGLELRLLLQIVTISSPRNANKTFIGNSAD